MTPSAIKKPIVVPVLSGCGTTGHIPPTGRSDGRKLPGPHGVSGAAVSPVIGPSRVKNPNGTIREEKQNVDGRPMTESMETDFTFLPPLEKGRK